MIERARQIADDAHRGQFREDGSPYFSHCLEVAGIISDEWGIKDESIVSAALLHDTVEDTSLSLDDIKNSFGEDIALLVDGVSKFKSDQLKSGDPDRETLKKVFDRNLIDPRIAVLKLADRLHNMRTLGSMPKEKQVPKARETLEVYAKLAESLGMWVVMKELEDLSLKYINPQEYERLKIQFENDPRSNELFISHTISSIESVARQSGIEMAVTVRKNSLWRLRHKSERVPRFKDINDVVSFRVVVNGGSELEFARDNCYKLLGIFREKYSTNEEIEKFSDSFSQPQENSYSAIQMTVNSPHGAIEIAITSSSKEEFNNWGVVSLLRKGNRELSNFALKLVFTPEGQVKFFPKEATGVDFAYSISRGLGAQAVSLLVDGEDHPLSFVIPNGSIVEIVTGEQRIAPDLSLYEYCLPPTKRVIEEQTGNLVREERIVKGKALVEDIIREKCGLLDLVDLFSFDEYKLKLTNLLYHLGCKGSLSNLYYLIGSGLISSELLSQQIISNGLTKNDLFLSTVLVEGVDRPGILEQVGAVIKKVGGNVGALDFKRKKEDGKLVFSLRLVVENLENFQIKELRAEIKKNCRMKKILIV